MAAPAQDFEAAGLSAVGHPLLAAMAPLADSDGRIFSGRLAVAQQPWLADHAVHGTVVFPGAGTLELALCAAQAVGAHGMSELTLLKPLRFDESLALRLQLSVTGDESTGRKLKLFSRSESVDGARSAGDS